MPDRLTYSWNDANSIIRIILHNHITIDVQLIVMINTDPKQKAIEFFAVTSNIVIPPVEKIYYVYNNVNIAE